MKYVSSFYINFQILDSIWVVIAQLFCMLQSPIQYLVKTVLSADIQGILACIVFLTMFV